MIDFRTVDEWHIGNDEVKKAWLNGTLVWEKFEVLNTTPFFVQNISGEDETLRIGKDSYADNITIEYSTDGITWGTLGTTSTTITRTLHTGEILYLRARTNRWCKYVSSQVGYYGNHIFGVSRIGGNILSLLYGSNFTGQETSLPSYSNIFREIFRNNNKLIDASKLLLPATSLMESCYMYMFLGCNHLVYAPTILPATVLVDCCYSYMFSGCNSLTAAPTLPATTLAGACYHAMFYRCYSLTNAPVLPATTLVDEITVNGSRTGCYAGMFQECTSLVNAPELPTPILTRYCYNQMFYGCTSLNYVKCLATDISATNCTYAWMAGQQGTTGTFVKNPNMSSWPTGTSGIPTGWTVQDAA